MRFTSARACRHNRSCATKPAWRKRFLCFRQFDFCRSARAVNLCACFCISHLPRQSKMTSIFFLTSIFNPSIHSSIAVFYLGPHIHEKWKGRIETWQPRKRQRRRPRRNNWLSHQTQGDAQASPLVFILDSVAPLRTVRHRFPATIASAPDASRILAIRRFWQSN
jgi:hypothetical protein